VRAGRSRIHTRRWIIIASIGILAGLTVVLVGLTAKLIVLGVVGFVLIVASCVYIATMLKLQVLESQCRGRRHRWLQAQASRGPVRMEDRLRKRFDEE